MPPKLHTIAGPLQPPSESEPEPDPQKMKCWLCKQSYDKSQLPKHIRVDHPMKKLFRVAQEVNSEGSPSSSGSGSGEVTARAVTQGQGDDQPQAQVQGPTRLSPDEPAPETSTYPHAQEDSYASDELEARDPAEDQGEDETAMNVDSEDIEKHIGDAHQEDADEHMEDVHQDTATEQPFDKDVAKVVIDVDSSSSPASASPVYETGNTTRTEGEVQVQGTSDAQVHQRAENEIRQLQGRRLAPAPEPPYGTRIQDLSHTQVQFHGRTQSQVQRGGANHWNPINDRKADDVEHEDEGNKRRKQENQDQDDTAGNKGSQKTGKQVRDFGSRESSPDGIQKTFQSLKQGDYGINWGGSDAPDASDIRGYGNGVGITNVRPTPGSIMRNQGWNLNDGYGMNGGGNGNYANARAPVHPGYNSGYGNVNRGGAPVRAGYGVGNPTVNHGSENRNTVVISNPESQFRRDQRMDIGNLVQDGVESDPGSVAGYTQQMQQQPQVARQFRDGSGAATANVGETGVAQISAQQFQKNRPRLRNPQPGRLQIASYTAGTKGPPTPIHSGSSPGSGSDLHSSPSSGRKRKHPSNGAEIDTEYSPNRTHTTAAATATESRRTTNSSAQAIVPRDAQGRPLTKDGAPRATRGSLAAKMPGPDPEPELDTPGSGTPSTDAWFRALFIDPGDMHANPPVEIWSHQSKPWETFQNELRRASRDVAGRFIEGQRNGFGLEHGNWFFTFVGRGTFKNDGSRVWGELGRHSIPYRDMASSVIGDPNRHGVLIMHVSWIFVRSD